MNVKVAVTCLSSWMEVGDETWNINRIPSTKSPHELLTDLVTAGNSCKIFSEYLM